MQLTKVIGKTIIFLFIVFSSACGNDKNNLVDQSYDIIFGSWKAEVLDIKYVHAVIKTDTSVLVPFYCINPKFNLVIDKKNNYHLTSDGKRSINGKYTFTDDTLKLYNNEAPFIIAKVDHYASDTLILNIEKAKFVEKSGDSLSFWSGDNIQIILRSVSR